MDFEIYQTVCDAPPPKKKSSKVNRELRKSILSKAKVLNFILYKIEPQPRDIR